MLYKNFKGYNPGTEGRNLIAIYLEIINNNRVSFCLDEIGNRIWKIRVTMPMNTNAKYPPAIVAADGRSVKGYFYKRINTIKTVIIESNDT
jgi:hypothetical protein